MSSRRWCFTLNNYTTEEIKSLDVLVCTYLVYGRETSSTGTPHLQGFIVFPKTKRLSGVQRILSRAHWEVSCGNDTQAGDYCKKDGDYTERGSPSKQGQRTDLKQVYEFIAKGADEVTLAETYPEQYSRYYKAFNRYRLLKTQKDRKAIPSHELHDWQKALYDEIQLEADERQILFVIDYVGNNGKSWFARYCFNSIPLVQIIDPGKKADMAYELRTDSKIVFIDVARSRTEVLDYHFLEKLKDGVVFSPKYESITKNMQYNVHVIVLMNEDPDVTKLSPDRYRYLYL